MEYAYATLILNEANREINEANITSVLEAAGVDVVESRAKAFVAAMEGVDLDETVDTPSLDAIGGEEAETAPVGTEDEPEASFDDQPDTGESGSELTAGATTSEPGSGSSGDDVATDESGGDGKQDTGQDDPDSVSMDAEDSIGALFDSDTDESGDSGEA